MKYTIIECTQGSPEWHIARTGRVTGSKADKVDSFKKSKSNEENKERKDLRESIIAELITGEPTDDGFVGWDMKQGIEREPFARMAYENHTGFMVRETGFLAVNDFAIGCSLDGDIDNLTGIIEAKCPKKNTHARYLIEDVVPEDYWNQVIHNMWVSGARWCDFVSYNASFPPNLQLFIKRVNRLHVESEIERYSRAVFKFLGEVDAQIKLLMNKHI